MMMSMIIVFMSLSGGSPQLKRMRRPIVCSVMNIRKRKLPDIFPGVCETGGQSGITACPVSDDLWDHGSAGICG